MSNHLATSIETLKGLWNAGFPEEQDLENNVDFVSQRLWTMNTVAGKKQPITETEYFEEFPMLKPKVCVSLHVCVYIK